MPRAAHSNPPVSNDNLEDLMDDEHWQDWEVVSEDRGIKLIWADYDKNGNYTGEGTRVFSGTFLGITTVPLNQDGEEDPTNPLDTADAAIFERGIKDDGTPQRYWCWQPFALAEVISKEKIKAGDYVRIACTRNSSTKRGLNPVKIFDIRVRPKS